MATHRMTVLVPAAEVPPLPALVSAREDDPLGAAPDSLWAVANAFGYRRYLMLFAEVRQPFRHSMAAGEPPLLPVPSARLTIQ